VWSFVTYVKGKVFRAHTIKAQREKRGTNPLVLNLDEWSPSGIHRFTPGSHWIRGRVRSKAFPDGLEQRKISCSCRDLTPDPPALRLVFIPNRLFLFPAPYSLFMFLKECLQKTFMHKFDIIFKFRR